MKYMNERNRGDFLNCKHGNQNHECLICKKVKEVLTASPTISYKERSGYMILYIKLPHGWWVAGANEKGSSTMSTINIEVSEDLRQNGIGEKLLRLLSDEAKQFGISTLTGTATNIPALKTRAKVFGESLIVIAPDPTTGRMAEVTVDEAMTEADEKTGDLFNVTVSVEL